MGLRNVGQAAIPIPMRLSPLLLLPSACFALACTDARTRACQSLAVKRDSIARATGADDASSYRRHVFYSSTLETCIVAEEKLTGVESAIRDLSGEVVRDMPYYPLFHCDRDGAAVVMLDSVRALHGLVANVPYARWLDDGSGSPPPVVRKQLLAQIRQAQADGYSREEISEALQRDKGISLERFERIPAAPYTAERCHRLFTTFLARL